MRNFAKGTAFFVFGVLCSPILLGLFVPIVAWELTASAPIVFVSTIVSFGLWAVVREWMMKNKWHDCL